MRGVGRNQVEVLIALLDLLDVALDVKAIAMLEKVLRRTGRSSDASAWYVVRRSCRIRRACRALKTS